MEAKKKFIFEIPYMNTVFCLCVILIHVISGIIYSDFAPLYATSKHYITLFKIFKLIIFPVQGFIFLSGLKLSNKFSATSSIRTYPKFVVNRIFKIIIPYTIWFFIYVAYLNFRPDYIIDDVNLYKAYFWGTLVGHMYFIPVIVQFYILMPIWMYMAKKIPPIIGVVLALSINILVLYMVPDLYFYYTKGQPFTLNSSLFTTYLYFWVAGIYCGMNYNKVCEYAKGHILHSLLIVIICGIGISFYSVVTDIQNHVMYFMDILYIIYQSAIIALLIGIFTKLSEKKEKTPFVINEISKASFSIYLSHVIFIYIAEHYCGENRISNPYAGGIYRAIGAYIICIILCIIFVELKRLFKFIFSKIFHRRKVESK